MESSAQIASPASLAEKEKYFRYEKVSEIFTYLGLFSAFFLSFLPYSFPIEKQGLYALFAFVFVFAFVWFRLLPKKYTGLIKTMIYYFATIAFVIIGVHFTSGIQSFAIFFFYLSVLSAAAALRLRHFLIIVVTISVLLLLEAIFFGHNIPLFQRLALAGVHIWALLIVALFGKSVFDEERRAEASEESVRLKAAKDLDNVKNEFVFVISNKLKQPIFALQSYLDNSLNQSAVLNKDLLELLNKTRENGQRLASLVNDLSDLSRIESQKLRLELKEINLNQLIGSTLSDFSMTATEKNINLTYEPNQDQINVLADSSRLHEVLANLIDNAVKYSPPNKTVVVRFKREEGVAKVEVQDQGYGIPDDAKAHLFEKFYRVNRSSSEPKGTGLGLFVSKELIERQGGKMWFESKVGEGTTFFFTLPLSKDGKQ